MIASILCTLAIGVIALWQTLAARIYRRIALRAIADRAVCCALVRCALAKVESAAARRDIDAVIDAMIVALRAAHDAAAPRPRAARSS